MAGGINQIDIKRKGLDVFNFVADPNNWPSVFKVTRWIERIKCHNEDGPLMVGDIVHEKVVVVGFPAIFEWTCTKSDPENGNYWLEGRIVGPWLMRFLGGGYCVISYSITAIPGEEQTRYTRYFRYLNYGLIMKSMQALFINTIMQHDFNKMQERVKKILEAHEENVDDSKYKLQEPY